MEERAVMPKSCETKQNLFCRGSHRKVYNPSFKW